MSVDTEESTFYDIVCSEVPKVSKVLYKYADHLKANPTTDVLPKAAKQAGCNAYLNIMGLRKVWESMLPQDTMPMAKRVLSRIPMVIFDMLQDCHCTVPAYHGKIAINPNVLRQVAGIVRYAEDTRMVFNLTAEGEHIVLDSPDRKAVYDILHSYIQCNLLISMVLESLVQLRNGIRSKEYESMRGYVNVFLLEHALEIPESLSDIICQVPLDQYWVFHEYLEESIEEEQGPDAECVINDVEYLTPLEGSDVSE